MNFCIDGNLGPWHNIICSYLAVDSAYDQESKLFANCWCDYRNVFISHAKWVFLIFHTTFFCLRIDLICSFLMPSLSKFDRLKHFELTRKECHNDSKCFTENYTRNQICFVTHSRINERSLFLYQSSRGYDLSELFRVRINFDNVHLPLASKNC